MDRGIQTGPQLPSGSIFSFVMSLEDMRSRREAEDWRGDQDGILVFARHGRTHLSPQLHIMKEEGGQFYSCHHQSGLFSVMVIVFIIGGNEKMQCTPIAEYARLID